MRAALIAGSLIACGSGAAHAVECYSSVSDPKIGEVAATVEVDGATGKVIFELLSWTPERNDGLESANFPRPGLLLDFSLKEDGSLEGPSTAHVMLSRISDTSDPSVGRAPSLNGMMVKVKRPGTDLLEWEYSMQAVGERRLARALAQGMPKTMSIELVGAKDKVMARADYDFARLGEVPAMMAKAKAETARKVAALQAEVAKGTAVTRCPA